MSNKSVNNFSGRRRGTAGKSHMLPPLNNNNNQLVNIYAIIMFIPIHKHVIFMLLCIE